MSLVESVVEEAAIGYLRELGYAYLHGSVIAPDGPGSERAAYTDVLLAGRLRAALRRINPHLDAAALDEVAKRVLRPVSPSLAENNLAFQTLLSRGVEVQVRRNGVIRGDLAWLVDFESADNDWLVVNQLTLAGGKQTRRPDVLVFLNGLPIAVIELKNPKDEQATIPAPQQAQDRDHLKELLAVSSGGVVFSTIQKFGVPKGERFPMLSDRRNIVVITDEAHRSQYEFIEGFARNLRDGLPNASFIGFTGTPIEFDDKSTPAVFGDYIDTYPITQAVEDGATVPIYYEARLARIALPDDKKPRVDEEFEEVTEGEEDAVKGKLKSKWARLEAMVGTEERIGLIAQDIVDHYERRQRIIEGKAMIVAMSRRIAVDLYAAIVALRPEWHRDDDAEGAIKVIMTALPATRPRFSRMCATRRRCGVSRSASRTPPTRWASSSCATCGSAASTPPARTRSTSTSR